MNPHIDISDLPSFPRLDEIRPHNERPIWLAPPGTGKTRTAIDMYNRARLYPSRSFVVPKLVSEAIKNRRFFVKMTKEKVEKMGYDATCSICLDNEDIKYSLLNCDHCFHTECIEEWMKKSKTCPLCRNAT